MKKIFLILILLSIGAKTYSQEINRDFSATMENEMKSLKNDAWTRFGIGLFAHAIGSSQFVAGPLSTPGVAGQFILYNSIGISFDALAIIQFIKLNKKKKNC